MIVFKLDLRHANLEGKTRSVISIFKKNVLFVSDEKLNGRGQPKEFR